MIRFLRRCIARSRRVPWLDLAGMRAGRRLAWPGRDKWHGENVSGQPRLAGKEPA